MCKETMQNIPDGQLFWIIKNGSPGTGMPAFSDLTDEQVWQLVILIRNLNEWNKAKQTNSKDVVEVLQKKQKTHLKNLVFSAIFLILIFSYSWIRTKGITRAPIGIINSFKERINNEKSAHS